MTVAPKAMRAALSVPAMLVLAACAVQPGVEPAEPTEPQAQAEISTRAPAEQEAAAQLAEAERRAEEERRQARLEAARQEAERQRLADETARAEALRLEAERQAELEAEAERVAAEQARLAKERAAAEEAARQAAAEAERKAAEEAEQARAAELAAAERATAAEAERLAAERRAQEQAAAERAEAERAAAEASDDAKFSGSQYPDAILPRTPENIARLGVDLTPMGSIRAGSADGRIPEWNGGITRDGWPAGYQPGERHLDPFEDDEPLYVITGDNYQQYRDRLSVGQIATFERYPDSYQMAVYPTRRSASFPEFVYEASIQNASTGRLIADGEGVADVAEGFPFPLPQNAYELMWNHKLKHKGTGGTRYNNQVAPTASGNYQLVRLREELLGLYYIEGNTIADTNNVLLYFFQEVESPARLAGNILLVHETLNQLEQPRQAWVYNPGQRRVRRAPNVAYDNPGTASDGLRTNDMTDMFNGAMDRFTWRIVGKRDMYVPYNAYPIHSGDLTPDDLVRPGHLNPEYTRYELHRMWVIEAELRPEYRHINARRTYYLDEDSYQILLVDHYDGRGELWRASESHAINYYDVPTFWSSIEVHMDLQSGRYIANGLDNQDPVNTFDVPLNPSSYTPQALRTRGRR
jgi:hypothetical protein